jgi:hypothetical protein
MTQQTKDLIAARHKKSGLYKGINNPHVKKWQVISPSKEVYIVIDGLGNFCQNHNLGSWNALVNAGIRNTPVTRGKCKGWIAFEIKDYIPENSSNGLILKN